MDDRACTSPLTVLEEPVVKRFRRSLLVLGAAVATSGLASVQLPAYAAPANPCAAKAAPCQASAAKTHNTAAAPCTARVIPCAAKANSCGAKANTCKPHH